MKELDEVLRVGGMMANLCFNLGQRSAGRALDQRDLARMRELTQQWDDARSIYSAARVRTALGKAAPTAQAGAPDTAQTTLTCAKCGQAGHGVLTCQAPVDLRGAGRSG